MCSVLPAEGTLMESTFHSSTTLRVMPFVSTVDPEARFNVYVELVGTRDAGREIPLGFLWVGWLPELMMESQLPFDQSLLRTQT